MKASLAVACVCLVVLAGCIGVQDSTQEASPTAPPMTEGMTPSETDRPTATASPAPTETVGSTATATATPTPTRTPTPIPPDNPWESETVTVTFYDRTDSDREFTQQIQDAVDYWNGRTAQYSEYNVTFSLEPGLEVGEANLAVIATEPIRNCGYTLVGDSFAGCYRHEHRFDVYVNQTDLQFRNTAIHEFGHALGLGHSDEPHWIMANTGDIDGSVTNASDRSNPWNETDELQVAVGESLGGEYESGIEDVVDYYNTNDHYVPDGMEIVVVDDWRAAEVTFEASSETSHGLEDGESISYVSGLDYDSDPAFEQYTAATIYLDDIDPDDVNFHAGYWIGLRLGNDEDDLPSQYTN